MKNSSNNKGKIVLLILLLLVVASGSLTAAAIFRGDLVIPWTRQNTEDAPPPEEPDEETVDELLEEDAGEEALPAWAPLPEPEPASFHRPGEMRGVYITPGIDILKTGDVSEAALKAEIDAALDNAVSLTMNSVIIDTVYRDKVLYHTAGSERVLREFDIMEYIVEGCRRRNLYTYAIFDASMYQDNGSAAIALHISAGTINKLSVNLAEFVTKYDLDGILLDGYTNAQAEQSYVSYLMAGGAMGYDNFMRESPVTVVKTAVKAIRRGVPHVQIGLLADAVWANKEENEDGSLTNASFTALYTGNADTKSFLEQGLFDFVAVKALTSISNTSEPFKEIVRWWGAVALENDVPLYVIHASGKMCTEEAGWQSHDQIARQVIEAGDVLGYRGSIFNNLQRMVEDPKEAATTLIKYYNKEVNPQFILTELQITKPEKNTYTTQEPAVTFTGASDPTSRLTLNGEEIETDESGYFTLTRDLKGGLNTFTFEHKEKVITYNITREILILKEIAPTGSMTTEGSMSISIAALAYHDAEVWAQVGGSKIPMQIDDTADSEEDRDSNYRWFTGEFTAPAATGEVQNLGSITVTGTWQGETMSLQGASVSVNKKKKIEDGVPVVVVAEQAMTYPPNTVNNIPNSAYYPLPRGAMDYAVGDEIVYTKDKKTYKYYVLASGLRVESGDIQAISNDYPGNNVVAGYAVSSEGGFTYVTINTAQQVSYSVKYTSSDIAFTFHNTVQSPKNANLDSNPLFSQATWSDGNRLTLSFIKKSGFMGYKGYYDRSGNLVLRFNNPPASISGARIVVDPGHGGSDTGALGFLRDYPERVINRAIASILADELEKRGASVLLLNTTGGMSLDNRVKSAEQWNAHLYVSVHNNTAPNINATGTEVYYFYPYAYNLALNATKSVSAGLNTNNRGAKYNYYHVTLSSQVPSILVECGFMSNKTEYEKLIRESYQQRVAAGIADALASHIKQIYPGGGGGGTQTIGNASATTNTESPGDEQPDDGSGDWDGDIPNFTDDVNSAVDGVEFESGQYRMNGGDTEILRIFSDDGELDNTDFKWKSSNSAVASVNSAGKVSAKKDGAVTITATSTKYGVEISCAVTVGEGASSRLEAVYMDLDELPLHTGEKQALEVLWYPDDITGVTFEWKSSDTSVAKVDQNGNVTGVSEGEAEVTATCTADKNLTAICYVYVSE